MDESLAWISFISSLLLVVGYELRCSTTHRTTPPLPRARPTACSEASGFRRSPDRLAPRSWPS